MSPFSACAFLCISAIAGKKALLAWGCLSVCMQTGEKGESGRSLTPLTLAQMCSLSLCLPLKRKGAGEGDQNSSGRK